MKSIAKSYQFRFSHFNQMGHDLFLAFDMNMLVTDTRGQPVIDLGDLLGLRSWGNIGWG